MTCVLNFLILFDLFQPASDLADLPVDAQPLWEYRGIACSEEFKLLSFDLTQDDLVVNNVDNNKSFDSSTNGIALWMDWELEDNICISSGPVVQPKQKDVIEWDMHSKQGVYFCQNPLVESKDMVIKFDTTLGDIKLTLIKTK